MKKKIKPDPEISEEMVIFEGKNLITPPVRLKKLKKSAAKFYQH